MQLLQCGHCGHCGLAEMSFATIANLDVEKYIVRLRSMFPWKCWKGVEELCVGCVDVGPWGRGASATDVGHWCRWDVDRRQIGGSDQVDKTK